MQALKLASPHKDDADSRRDAMIVDQTIKSVSIDAYSHRTCGINQTLGRVYIHDAGHIHLFPQAGRSRGTIE